MKQKYILTASVLTLLLAAPTMFAQFFNTYTPSSYDTYGGAYDGGGGGYTPSFGTTINSRVYGSPSSSTTNSNTSNTSSTPSTSTTPSSSSSTSSTKCPSKSLVDHTVPADASGVKLTQEGKVNYMGTSDAIPNLWVDGVDKTIYYEGPGSPLPVAVGKITICGDGYPEYGHLLRLKLLEAKGELKPETPSTPAPTGPVDMTVPEDTTAVTLNPDTGEVSNACTGYVYTEARYDKSAKKILYGTSGYGKVLTDTKGYINIDTRKANFTCYKWGKVAETPPPPEAMKDKEKLPEPEKQPEPEKLREPEKKSEPEKIPEPIKAEPKSAAQKKIFVDVAETDPLRTALEEAVTSEWIKPTKNFKPEKKMSRCTFAELLIRATGEPIQEGYNGTLKDVPKNSEFASSVHTAVSKGFMKPRLKKKPDNFSCTKAITLGEVYAALDAVQGVAGSALPKNEAKKTPTRSDILLQLYNAAVQAK